MEISPALVMYRLTKEHKPTNEDFHSLRKLRPEAKHQDLNECIARGLSVFSDPIMAKRRAKRRLDGYSVCRVRLDRGAGKIMRTSGPNHYTWWPYDSFDILANCEPIAND